MAATVRSLCGFDLVSEAAENRTIMRNALTKFVSIACLMLSFSFSSLVMRSVPGADLSAIPLFASQDPTPPQLTFPDLKRNDSVTRTFIVAGFVIDAYKCPPCPPQAMCKPCIGDHITITDKIDEKDKTLIQRLRIHTEKPEQFDLKKQYSFTVKVRGNVSPGHAIQDVDLISFEPVKK